MLSLPYCIYLFCDLEILQIPKGVKNSGRVSKILASTCKAHRKNSTISVLQTTLLKMKEKKYPWEILILFLYRYMLLLDVLGHNPLPDILDSRYFIAMLAMLGIFMQVEDIQ